LNLLVRASRAIADGDLRQRTGVQSSDEIGLLANTFDTMTERLAQRSAELQNAYQVLEQMDRTKASFITVAAHELRTPLTLIRGYTQMLETSPTNDAEQQEMIHGILGGAGRMQEVVDSMMDVSRIDSQTLQLVPQTIAIAPIIDLIQINLESVLVKRKLTLTMNGLQDLPAIYADPDLLQKVFYQVIVNAVKFTPDYGAITISGEVISKEPQPAEIEIVVSDTGIGIDPQHHQLIFEKFYQTGEVSFHSSGKTKFKGGGPGLGLAIARGIVLAHRGKIWVESPGHDEKQYPGSRFYIRLPIHKAQATR
jgi:signal transduction histidine kinase